MPTTELTIVAPDSNPASRLEPMLVRLPPQFAAEPGTSLGAPAFASPTTSARRSRTCSRSTDSFRPSRGRCELDAVRERGRIPTAPEPQGTVRSGQGPDVGGRARRLRRVHGAVSGGLAGTVRIDDRGEREPQPGARTPRNVRARV